MKKLTVLALAVVMLALCGAAVAEEEAHEHYALCSAPKVCAECGEAYAGSNIYHEGLMPAESLNETLHMVKCKDCGEQWIVPHEERCTKPGECYECGAPMMTELIKHRKTHWEHNEKEHWEVCGDCGKILSERVGHFGFCTKPGVCYDCGIPYAVDVVNHMGPTHFESDESSHWKICDGCGETMQGPEGHSINCQTPNETTCYYCGEKYSGNNRAHVARKTVDTDAEYHWDACANCGTRLSTPARHRVNCDGLTGCQECGADIKDIANPELVHAYVGYRFDVATHWRQCSCGQVQTEREPHGTSPDVEGWCPVCECDYGGQTSDDYENGRNTNNRLGKLAWYKDGELVDFTGLSSFNGALFYFEHGVARDDLMGPVQINGVWYAFDAGRVMEQEMLVSYDGGVFAFKNGTIDRSKHGLVTFDGEQFVFAYGQYQANVYGAWNDPTSGDWVYVWAGQYYETTDLVRYDGEIFYFINGKLALDFTGVVKDFKGTEFNVVNGQVVD